MLAHQPHHPFSGRHVRIGDDDHPCPHQTGRLQDLGSIGAAEDHTATDRCRLLHLLWVDVQGKKWEAFGCQQLSHTLAGSAIAADNGVPLKRESGHGHLVDRLGLVRPVAPRHRPTQTGDTGDQKGRHEHRDQHRRQGHLEHVHTDQLRLVGKPNQYQAKLTTLGQLRRRAQGHVERVTRRQRHYQNHQPLAGDQQDDGKQQAVKVG